MKKEVTKSDVLFIIIAILGCVAVGFVAGTFWDDLNEAAIKYGPR